MLDDKSILVLLFEHDARALMLQDQLFAFTRQRELAVVGSNEYSCIVCRIFHFTRIRWRRRQRRQFFSSGRGTQQIQRVTRNGDWTIASDPGIDRRKHRETFGHVGIHRGAERNHAAGVAKQGMPLDIPWPKSISITAAFTP